MSKLCHIADLDGELRAEVESWLEGKDPILRDLFEQYPPNTMLIIDSEQYFVVGFEEPHTCEHWRVMITLVDPLEDNAKAIEESFPVCSNELLKNEVLVH